MSGTLGLALLAGLLSTLSPCVLPLLPIVLGAAATEHRLGPAALAAGLASSFVAVGLFVATLGFSLGLDGERFREGAAILLLGLGVVLLAAPLQARIAVAAGPAGAWIGDRLGGLSRTGVRGQFGVGLLLGAVWSPCVGPTLGAASVLAAEGRDLGRVALTMGVFGLGAAAPLLLIGSLSREVLVGWRRTLTKTGGALRVAFGLVLVLGAGAVLTGADKRVETRLVSAAPAWLTDLTSRY